MKKEELLGLYDIMVYLTFYYDSMPAEFKKRFSKEECFGLRSVVFNNLPD